VLLQRFSPLGVRNPDMEALATGHGLPITRRAMALRACSWLLGTALAACVAALLGALRQRALHRRKVSICGRPWRRSSHARRGGLDGTGRCTSVRCAYGPHYRGGGGSQGTQSAEIAAPEIQDGYCWRK